MPAEYVESPIVREGASFLNFNNAPVETPKHVVQKVSLTTLTMPNERVTKSCRLGLLSVGQPCKCVPVVL